MSKSYIFQYRREARFTFSVEADRESEAHVQAMAHLDSYEGVIPDDSDDPGELELLEIHLEAGEEVELREELRGLVVAFELAGGRGIDLANRIDELREQFGEDE